MSAAINHRTTIPQPGRHQIAGDMDDYDARKSALLGALTGTVLEIGAGDGANFPDLPAGIAWHGLEPNPNRCRSLVRTAAAYGHHAPVITAPAERIPLGDASVDAVLATTVLCSVTDQKTALAEVRRVLRPDGAFVFFEHVAAPAGTWARRAQRCWAHVTRRVDAGCDPSRETWRAIETAGFREVQARWYTRQPGHGIYNPFLGGIAHV
jgi:ubiquinone/menaquinone biosynthesis C-methylase UbiE